MVSTIRRASVRNQFHRHRFHFTQATADEGSIKFFPEVERARRI